LRSDAAGDGDRTEELRAEIRRLKAELAEARRRVAELEARVDIDPLLEILNRRGFERELVRAVAHVSRYGTEVALLFVDLDGFKAVNDHYGHAAGDALLKVVAAEITAHVRASDVIGRLGGDEFGIVMWNVGPSVAAAKALDLERLVERVTMAHGGSLLSVGASVGIVAVLPELGPAALIDAADRAMYARKRDRRR
jgi:diguanylate cyclase (GGDEF)-like protein